MRFTTAAFAILVASAAQTNAKPETIGINATTTEMDATTAPVEAVSEEVVELALEEAVEKVAEEAVAQQIANINQFNVYEGPVNIYEFGGDGAQPNIIIRGASDESIIEYLPYGSVDITEVVNANVVSASSGKASKSPSKSAKASKSPSTSAKASRSPSYNGKSAKSSRPITPLTAQLTAATATSSKSSKSPTRSNKASKSPSAGKSAKSSRPITPLTAQLTAATATSSKSSKSPTTSNKASKSPSTSAKATRSPTGKSAKSASTIVPITPVQPVAGSSNDIETVDAETEARTQGVMSFLSSSTTSIIATGATAVAIASSIAGVLMC